MGIEKDKKKLTAFSNTCTDISVVYLGGKNEWASADNSTTTTKSSYFSVDFFNSISCPLWSMPDLGSPLEI